MDCAKFLQSANVSKEIIDIILKTVKPAYEVIIGEPENYLSVGNSRMGGMPDLPESISYPFNHLGFPYQLVVQLNLEDFQMIVVPNLPKTGILYVFMDTSTYKHKIIYYDNHLNDLKKITYELSIFKTYHLPFDSFKIKFEPVNTIDDNLLKILLRNDLSIDYEILQNNLLKESTRFGGNEYSPLGSFKIDGLCFKSNLSDLEHKMYNYNLHYDGIDTIEQYEKSFNVIDNLNDAQKVDYFNRKKEELISAQKFVNNRGYYQELLNKWHTLFICQSENKCFEWGSPSFLAFYIHEDDILNLNFSNTYLNGDYG